MVPTVPQEALPLDVALQQAVAHHQAGRLSEAEDLYRAILQAQPGQPDANHNLGVLAMQVGQHAAALPYLKTALAINPAQGQYALSPTLKCFNDGNRMPRSKQPWPNLDGVREKVKLDRRLLGAEDKDRVIGRLIRIRYPRQRQAKQMASS